MSTRPSASRWLRRLLAQPVRSGRWGSWRTRYGPVLWSAREGPASAERPLFLSPGFASSVRDYAPLAELFQARQTVYRVGHPGSDRWAAVGAGLRWLWQRWALAAPPQEAALQVRAYLHRESLRERRLAQLCAAIKEERRRHGLSAIDLAGHSYGTDTALLFALRYGHEIEIATLYLFSPHPPGYLIAMDDYASLPVNRVIVVTGTRDRTRDGVGPEQRQRVANAVGDKAQLIVLEGVAHMDFAFADLGPPQWPQQLAQALDLGGGDALGR